MDQNLKYIDEHELSRIIGRKVSTLRNDRFYGQGIPYCKFGRMVRYSINEVHKFMEDHLIRPSERG